MKAALAFSSLLALPLCRCLPQIPSKADLDLTSANHTASFLQGHLSNLTAPIPPPPADFAVVPTSAGGSFPINAAQAAHTLLYVFLMVWSQPRVLRVPPTGEVFHDTIFNEWTFRIFVFPAAYSQYGSSITIAWSTLKIIASQLDDMTDDQINWIIPTRGWLIGNDPSRIGICSLQKVTATDEGNITASLDVPLTQNQTDVLTQINESSLGSPGIRLVFLSGSVNVSRKAVLWVLFKYLDTVFGYPAAEAVAKSHERGEVYKGDVFNGVQLTVEYSLLSSLQKSITWIDIVGVLGFIIKALASPDPWKDFRADGIISGDTRPFLKLHLESVAGSNSPTGHGGNATIFSTS